MIVADTNILAYFALPGPRTEAALALMLRDPEWVAPPLWRSEFRNVLVNHLRAGSIEFADAEAAFSTAEEYVTDVHLSAVTPECLALATSGHISAYDAEFVLLAVRLGVPLVTGDRELARAFPQHVTLLEEFVSLG